MSHEEQRHCMDSTNRIAMRCGFALATALLVLSTGCQSIANRNHEWRSPKEMFSDLTDREEKIVYGEPQRMAVIWTDSAMTGDAGKTTRGFGGRVYFYDKNNQAIRVDGEFSVYAFDDSVEPKKSSPDRTFKFRKEELQTHYSLTPIGPSYSFWLPWDKIGGERKSIALLPMFKTDSNQIVRGEQSLNTLSGTAPANAGVAAKQNYYVLGSSPALAVMPHSTTPKSAQPQKYAGQQVSFESVDAEQMIHQLRTTTIEVPRDMASRLKSTPPDSEAFAASTEPQTSITYGRNEAANPPPTATNQGNRPVFGVPGAMR